MSLLYKPLLTLSLLAVTVLNVVGHSAQAEVAYTITDLGTLGGVQTMQQRHCTNKRGPFENRRLRTAE